MTPGSPEAWEGHNSMNTYPNGVSEESIGHLCKEWMPIEWLHNRFGPRTTKIWPFEAARALKTTAAAKAPRWLGGLPKQKCVGSLLGQQHMEAAKNPREYYRGVVSFPTPKCPSVT